MQEMTQRERTLRCLRFEPADRLCLDGTFRPEVWKMLENHFSTGEHDEIRGKLGMGFLAGATRSPAPEWLERSRETEQGPVIVHPDGVHETEWGVQKVFDDTGTYERYVYHPLSDPGNIGSYKPPSLEAPGVWDSLNEKVQKLGETEVISAPIPTFYRWGWELRGMEDFLCDIALESKELKRVLDMLEEYHVELARRYGQMGVEVVNVWGDLAMQTTTLMAPDAWRKHFKPRMARVIETARSNGVGWIYLHSDGNNSPIMEDLVEIGVDILDPVQPECMDPTELREKYPRLIMRSTISSQKTLPFGTKEDVRAEVLERIEKCGYNNGLVLAPNNVVQFDVPLENLLCLYETVMEIGGDFFKN